MSCRIGQSLGHGAEATCRPPRTDLLTATVSIPTSSTPSVSPQQYLFTRQNPFPADNTVVLTSPGMVPSPSQAGKVIHYTGSDYFNVSLSGHLNQTHGLNTTDFSFPDYPATTTVIGSDDTQEEHDFFHLIHRASVGSMPVTHIFDNTNSYRCNGGGDGSDDPTAHEVAHKTAGSTRTPQPQGLGTKLTSLNHAYKKSKGTADMSGPSLLAGGCSPAASHATTTTSVAEARPYRQSFSYSAQRPIPNFASRPMGSSPIDNCRNFDDARIGAPDMMDQAFPSTTRTPVFPFRPDNSPIHGAPESGKNTGQLSSNTEDTEAWLLAPMDGGPIAANRIAEAGPVRHPDPEWRPYGANHWHVFVRAPTTLKYLSTTEIKEIREHCYDLARAAGGGGRRARRQAVPIANTGFTTADAQAVWRHCDAYIRRRGQVRNNKAARRSRQRKDAELRYWKTRALEYGCPDHDFEWDGRDVSPAPNANAYTQAAPVRGPPPPPPSGSGRS